MITRQRARVDERSIKTLFNFNGISQIVQAIIIVRIVRVKKRE